MSIKYLVPVRFECDGTKKHTCSFSAMGTAACVEDFGAVRIPIVEPGLPEGWAYFSGNLLCPGCFRERMAAP